MKCSTEFKEWLKKGLKKRDKDRFSTMKEAMDHDWFGGFDWEALNKRSLTAPFKPDITVANCEATADLQNLVDSDDVEVEITEEQQIVFGGYDYPVPRRESLIRRMSSRVQGAVIIGRGGSRSSSRASKLAV